MWLVYIALFVLCFVVAPISTAAAGMLIAVACLFIIHAVRRWKVLWWALAVPFTFSMVFWVLDGDFSWLITLMYLVFLVVESPFIKVDLSVWGLISLVCKKFNKYDQFDAPEPTEIYDYQVYGFDSVNIERSLLADRLNNLISVLGSYAGNSSIPVGKELLAEVYYLCKSISKKYEFKRQKELLYWLECALYGSSVYEVALRGSKSVVESFLQRVTSGALSDSDISFFLSSMTAPIDLSKFPGPPVVAISSVAPLAKAQERVVNSDSCESDCFVKEDASPRVEHDSNAVESKGYPQGDVPGSGLDTADIKTDASVTDDPVASVLENSPDGCNDKVDLDRERNTLRYYFSLKLKALNKEIESVCAGVSSDVPVRRQAYWPAMLLLNVPHSYRVESSNFWRWVSEGPQHEIDVWGGVREFRLKQLSFAISKLIEILDADAFSLEEIKAFEEAFICQKYIPNDAEITVLGDTYEINDILVSWPESDYCESADFYELKELVNTYNMYSETLKSLIDKLNVSMRQELCGVVRVKGLKMLSTDDGGVVCVHSCSKTICDAARWKPFYYVCKYFGVSTDTDTQILESLIEDFKTVEGGRALVLEKEREIQLRIKEAEVVLHELTSRLLEKKLGFVRVVFKPNELVHYRFRYQTKAGGKCSICDIAMDIENLSKLVERLRLKSNKVGKSVYRDSSIPADMRLSVLKRDGFTCKKCGATKDVEVFPILPVAIGGQIIPTNLQTLCSQCRGESVGATITSELQIVYYYGKAVQDEAFRYEQSDCMQY